MKNQPKASATAIGAQHTPGPWFISAGSAGQFHTVRNDETPVAHVLPLGDKPEVYANARVLAAAPDLLAALAKCVTWAETYARQSGIDLATSTGPLAADINQARAAIAKAEGAA